MLTLVVYWPVYHFGFISYDDGSYVYTNPHLQDGFSRAGLWFAFNSYRMGNWNPLLWLSFFVDRILFKLRPGPMHVENVLLHLAGGLLVWRLLALATGSVIRSWIVAALFLVHPMHVESVAWITERKDVLSTPLLMAAMICYVKFARSPTPVPRYSEEPGKTVEKPGSWVYFRTGVWFSHAAMLLLFALSLMAKTMGVTMPAVLLLMDFWPLGRWPRFSWRRLIVEKVPLILLSLGASIIGSIAQHKAGATATLHELGLVDRINNAIVCYVMYALKLIVPRHLAIFYPHPESRPAAAVFAAAALLVLIVLIFARFRRRCPYLIVGWLWFMGTLVPVIGLVQIGGQAMADRYSYFPSIGLLMLMVWGAGDLIRLIIGEKHTGRQVTAGGATASIVIAVFTFLAARQVSYWRDTETLFTHALNVGENSSVAHVVLAHVAYNRHDLVKTVNECIAALDLGPDSRAYYTLGNCFLGVDPERASGYFQKAVDHEPGSVEYHVSLATSLRLAGHLDKARAAAQAALALDPDDAEAQEEMRAINAAKHS